jgi:hypothetical protein
MDNSQEWGGGSGIDRDDFILSADCQLVSGRVHGDAPVGIINARSG